MGTRRHYCYLGDYIDRGPSSREVVECLMNWRLDGYEHFNLKGNHEAMMLAACRGQAELGWWIRNGGNSTLAPYGEVPDHPDLRAIPPGHLGWMESCLFSTWTDTSARSEICELDDFDTPKLSQLNKSALTAANACDLLYCASIFILKFEGGQVMGLNFSRGATVLGILVGSLFPVVGKADVYTFDVLNTVYGFEATGTFTTDASNNIISASGNVVGGPDPGSISLIAGPNPPNVFIPPPGVFQVNNVYYPASDPQFDVYGMLFQTANAQYNVWGNGAGNYSFYAYYNGYLAGDGPGQVQITIAPFVETSVVQAAFAAPAVPEPATWVMMILGFLGIVFVANRRRSPGSLLRLA